MGDDTGFASQATLSRQKQSLEDAGLVETSKVQCDIGRPRYRLHLSGPLAGDVAGVVKACEEVLASE
jgi:DNA-binding HxlR family transcriptional regulator